MRLIDADMLKKYIVSKSSDSERFLQYVDEQPTVQIEETKWISVEDRLPRPKGDSYWAKCIVSVMRSYYPTSTYDICDAPYDEEYVAYANYDAVQKIWHLNSDEQVNALISIEDAPLNGDCVIAWMPLPEPYKEG